MFFRLFLLFFSLAIFQKHQTKQLHPHLKPKNNTTADSRQDMPTKKTQKKANFKLYN